MYVISILSIPYRINPMHVFNFLSKNSMYVISVLLSYVRIFHPIQEPYVRNFNRVYPVYVFPIVPILCTYFHPVNPLHSSPILSILRTYMPSSLSYVRVSHPISPWRSTRNSQCKIFHPIYPMQKVTVLSILHTFFFIDPTCIPPPLSLLSLSVHQEPSYCT